MKETISDSLRPRSPIWILLVGLTIAFGINVLLTYQSMRVGPIAPPVEVVVEVSPSTGVSPPASSPRAPVLIHVFLSRHQDPPLKALVQENRRRWEIKEKWVRSLLLAGPPEMLDRVNGVTLRIGGNRVWHFPQTTWEQNCPEWKGKLLVNLPAGWQVREMTAAIPPAHSIVPSFRTLINYPGDFAAVGRAMLNAATHPAMLLLFATLALILTARYWLPARLRTTAALNRLLGDPVLSAPSDDAGTPGKELERVWTWGLAGFVLVSGCLAFLEWRQPYYFVQDDNFSQFLPGMLAGCRAAFAGYVPDWNPYQCLGSPLAEVGTYALTYPVTYLSYALATYGLGDEYATMDLFCGFHVLAGYAACFWLGRQLRLTAPTTAALAICWALCGYSLLVGRSWYYMTPSFVGYPLLAIAVLSLQRSVPGWRWVLGTGLVIGGLFHAGNAQMWAYGMEFFGLWILGALLTRALPWPRLPAVAAALAVGLGLASILLVPQLLATGNIERPGASGGHDVMPGVAALFFPYPIGQLGTDNRYWCGNDQAAIAQVYYAGSVFSLAWLFGSILAAAFQGPGKTYWRNPLFALSMLAFLLGLGKLGLLWPLQGLLPVFNKFGHALKYLPLFHLFALAMGAVLLERFIRHMGLSARWLRIGFVVVASLMLYHVALAFPSFYSYGDMPYPRLSPSMITVLRHQAQATRILPICPPRSPAPGYVVGLQHNFPTVYQIDALTGYDPLVEKRPEFLRVARRLEKDFPNAIRRYGVTDVIVHRFSKRPQYNGSSLARAVEAASLYLHLPVRDFCDRGVPILSTEEVTILPVDDSDPLAFPVADRNRRFSLERTPAGLEVDVSPLAEGGAVVINYLWYPRIRVTADSAPVAASADPFGRIQVEVPRGVRRLTVAYETPWRLGLGIGAVLTAVGVVGFGVMNRRGKYPCPAR